MFKTKDSYDIIHQNVIDKFKDKTDKGGAPYIEHLYRVADRAEEIQVGSYIVGLLHDYIEDTQATAEDVFLLTNSNKVTRQVDALSKKHDESYDSYIKRIQRHAKLYKDPVVLAVKIADIEDNLNLSRLKDFGQVNPDKIKQYMQARSKLQASLKNIRGF